MTTETTNDDKAPESGETTKAPEAKESAPGAATEPARAIETKAPAQGEFTEEKPTTTAIVQHVEWAHSLEPRTLRDAFHMSKVLFESRLFGHLNNPEGIFAAALMARAHGIETMKILQPGVLHNIKGKISMSAQLIVGLVLRSGKAEYFDLVESTVTKATYVTKRRGASRPVEFSFTIEEAKAAGYLEKPDSSWRKTPKTMLRHRCETELARAVYPDVVGGLYSPDDLESVESAA